MIWKDQQLMGHSTMINEKIKQNATGCPQLIDFDAERVRFMRMNCLKASLPLNKTRDSSTHKSLAGLYTAAQRSHTRFIIGRILPSWSRSWSFGSRVALSAKCRKCRINRKWSRGIISPKMPVLYTRSEDQYMVNLGLYTMPINTQRPRNTKTFNCYWLGTIQ